MEEYEFVIRKEYVPVKAELEMIIRRVQKIMKEKYDVSFDYRLIGSARKHLITRVKGGNKGFDFDYNFVVDTPCDWEWNAKVLKQQCLNAISEAIRGTNYKFPENSTSVATIKVVNRNKSSIEYGCDFAIIYFDDKDDYNSGYWYLKNYKNGGYGFEFRNNSRNVYSKVDAIMDYNKYQGWEWIRGGNILS